MSYIGDFVLGSVVRVRFTTTSKTTGSPIAPSSAFVAADFRVYKNGSASEKTTTNGVTVTSPFDSVTGRHLIEIDTSNNTGDAGFWEAGATYWVDLNTAKTVDGETISGLTVGMFSVENRNANANVTRWRGSTPNALNSGRVDSLTGAIETAVTGAISLAIAGDIEANDNGWDAATPTLANTTANAVRSNLTTELARIDVSISSRLASASYTAPANATIETIAAVTTKLDSTMELDGAAYRFTANALELAPSGGGGGDATEANQLEIIAILQGNTVSPQNALTPSGNLVVYNRRTYDGVAHPFISFATTKDYTTATTLELMLHAKDNVDTVYQTLSATAASATLIRASGTISLDSLTYAGCPLTAQIAYTLRATWTTAEETIATGGAYVYAQP